MTADAETRAEVLAEIRQVLALLKGQAAGPPVRFEAPPPPTPEKDVLEALRAHHTGAALTPPEGLTVQHAGPTPAVLGLLDRLAYLLGLSGLEREFFTACASDKLLDAFDGRLAYADWLEERGDTAGAVRVRKLTPQPGDVLVFTAPPGECPQDGAFDGALRVQEALAARGVDVSWVLLPHGSRLDRLSAQQTAGLGLVPAKRLAQVREGCAALAEHHHYYRLAAELRADLSLAEMEAADAPAPGGNTP